MRSVPRLGKVFIAVKRIDPRILIHALGAGLVKRTFDEWLTFLCVAGLGWDEAVQVAREMVAPRIRAA